LHPAHLVFRRIDELELSDLKRNDFESRKHPCRVHIGEIHEHEVIAVFLKAAYPSIVVEEIPAAIENEMIAINLDGFWMM
jgi:hypothetical protein